MTFLRFILHTTAILAGAYAALTWTLGLLTDAGIAGAISAAVVVAAEGIRYCTDASRERMRLGREAVWERRDIAFRLDLPPDLDRVQADWLALLDAEAQDAARHTAMPRPVWPHEVGAPE